LSLYIKALNSNDTTKSWFLYRVGTTNATGEMTAATIDDNVDDTPDKPNITTPE
jgi:hypothetical protein